MAKRNTELFWGPYRDWAEARAACPDDESNDSHRSGEGNPGFWGPLFAAAQESLGTLPASVVAQRSLRSFLEFVERMRSRSATVRFPKPPTPGDSVARERERWKPFRLVQSVGQGKVLLKKGSYHVLFHAGDSISMLKLVELDDGRGARRGELLELGSLSRLAREDDLVGVLGATLKAAGLEVIWDSGLRDYLSNQRRHLLRQQTAFEAVPEGQRAEYRSFSAMPRNLRRRLAKEPSDRVAEGVRPQYLLNRKRLVELGLADKLNEMQAHDAALLGCKQRAVAAQEQGLGKTRTCIAAAVLSGCRSVLIVCYSRLVAVWQGEFETLGLGDDVQLVESRGDISSSKRFHIVSYERLAVSTERSTDLRCQVCHGPLSPGMRRCPACRRRVWTQTGCPQCGATPDKAVTYCRNCGYCPSVYTPPLYRAMRRRYSMAIFDESQAAKSRSAQRSRACASIRTRRTLLATGTMLENYVAEAFWQLHLLFRGSCLLPYPFEGGEKRFVEEFATVEVTDGHRKIVPGVKNLDKWHRMMDWVMIRRSWDDPEVQETLPVPTANLETVWVNPTETELDLYDALQARFKEWYDARLAREQKALAAKGYLLPEEQLSPVEIMSQLTTLRRVASQPWSFEWYQGDRNTSKLRAVDSIVSQAVKTGEKVVLASWQRDVVEELGRRLDRYGCGVIRRDVPIAERNRLIKAFQEERNPKVLAVTTGAAGLGITLTRATTVVLLDLEWSPATMAQMWKRAHRIGQTKELKVVFLLADLPIERQMDDLLARKGAAIAQAMRDKAPDVATSAIDWREFVMGVLNLSRSGRRVRLLEVGQGQAVSVVVGMSDAEVPQKGSTSVVHWGHRLLEIAEA